MRGGAGLLEEDSDVDFCKVCRSSGSLEIKLAQFSAEVGRRRARDEQVEDIDRPHLLPARVGVRIVGHLVSHVELVIDVIPAGRPADGRECGVVCAECGRRLGCVEVACTLHARGYGGEGQRTGGEPF